MSNIILPHGGRPTKNGLKRKGVDDYVAENPVDFTSCSMTRDGKLVQCLVCRFCCQSIGARSDRIKEHLESKRHKRMKLEAVRGGHEEEHQGTSPSGGLGGGGSSNGYASPPPPTPALKDRKGQQSQQLLRVKWPGFASNRGSMFSMLRSQERFVDATLWCEGKMMKCHKMILSACSTYFEKLLTEYPDPHPVIILKDLHFWEVQALVEFMYGGEVRVPKDKLPKLIQAAESLQIKGLGCPTRELGVQGSNGGSMNGDVPNSTVDMTPNAQTLQGPHQLLGAGSNSNNNHKGSGGGQAPKHWKRPIDRSRTAGMSLPDLNLTMGSETEEGDDASSEEYMAAHEGNYVDLNMHQDQSSYVDDDDMNCDQPDNYEQNDAGLQGEEDISEKHGHETG